MVDQAWLYLLWLYLLWLYLLWLYLLWSYLVLTTAMFTTYRAVRSHLHLLPSHHPKHPMAILTMAILTMAILALICYLVITPTMEQARYALICQSEGIVPIVEPDLVLAGTHTLEDAVEVRLPPHPTPWLGLGLGCGGYTQPHRCPHPTPHTPHPTA